MIDFIGGCSRTRTCDPLIKSQLLYQLSYAPAAGGVYSKPHPVCRESSRSARIRAEQAARVNPKLPSARRRANCRIGCD
jgi:hypothetical protein